MIRQFLCGILVLSLGACMADPPAPTGDAGPPIACLQPDGRTTCPAGQVCTIYREGTQIVSACRAACDAPGASCPDGTICVSDPLAPALRYCQPRCTRASDCGPGLSCDVYSGHCACANDASCAARYGQASACVRDRCVPRCATDAACPCGSLCQDRACVTGCREDTDCCGAATCSAGRCVGEAPTTLGGRCDRNDDCAAGLACFNDHPRGACDPIARTTTCGPDACPAGSNCRAVFTTAGTFVPRCQPACTPGSDAGCLATDACRPVPTDPARGVCIQRCASDDACVTGLHCDTASGLCRCADDPPCQRTYGPNARCDATTQLCVCTPQCDGRTCGSDGCGGSCGACAVGTACHANGRCGAPTCGDGNFVVACPAGGACPNNSHCQADGNCGCDTGYDPVQCSGAACNNNCTAPGWWCRPHGGTGPTCGAVGAACADASECCSGACDAASGQCRCAPLEAVCRGGEDCCTGNCDISRHRCAPDVSCNSSSRCSPQCPRGLCSDRQLCSPAGTCCAPTVQCGIDPVCGTQTFCGSLQECVAGRCINPCAAGGSGACPAAPDGSPQRCMGGACGTCLRACNGSTCGTLCSGASCGSCRSGYECRVMAGGYYCTATCPRQCAGRSCGADGCGGTCGSCATGQTCTAAGTCMTTTDPGGGTCLRDGAPCSLSASCCSGRCALGTCQVTTGGGTCTDASGCATEGASTDPLCRNYVSVNNRCGQQIRCQYTLRSGRTGCVFPQTGINSCSFYNDPADPVTSVRCNYGPAVPCAAAIGCGL
jgi:hypothetical protein